MPIDSVQVGDTVLVPGQPGVVIKVLTFTVSSFGNQAVRFYSGPSANGKLLGGLALPLLVAGDDLIAATPNAVTVPQLPRGDQDWGPAALFQTNPGDALVLNLSDPNETIGHVIYATGSPTTPPI
jgi:hypothetical protein